VRVLLAHQPLSAPAGAVAGYHLALPPSLLPAGGGDGVGAA
jgi:hypothetical protein